MSTYSLAFMVGPQELFNSSIPIEKYGLRLIAQKAWLDSEFSQFGIDVLEKLANYVDTVYFNDVKFDFDFKTKTGNF